jgi:4-methylaminobutanoate oxidase (formaldehyde-forming)
VARHADWPAWRILVPADHGAAVAEALFERAAPVGHLAAESLRVHHGVPRFGAEATGGIDAVAAGLAARLDFERGFVGRDAVLRARANAPRRTVGRFAVAAMARGLDLEPVVEGTRTVGYVTSSTYAALDGRVELFALIERDAASPKVLADGAWRPLTPNR